MNMISRGFIETLWDDCELALEQLQQRGSSEQISSGIPAAGTGRRPITVSGIRPRSTPSSVDYFIDGETIPPVLIRLCGNLKRHEADLCHANDSACRIALLKSQSFRVHASRTGTFPKEAFVLGIRYLPAIFPIQSLLLITGANWMERPAARPGQRMARSEAATPIHPEASNDSRFLGSRVTVLGGV